jgi:tRNA dimethylallyltransferase
MKYLITIVGPTAIGKTSLSIALAQHFNCEIISCDSRQFFKEMTIGTAVPNQLELSSAKHHFIHNKSIFEVYNVGDFEKEAILKLEGLYTNNDIVILVGGSGLYVDAILKGFDAIPEIEKTIRENIKLKYELNGIKFLIESLKKLDPNYYTELSENNPQTLLNPQRMMRFVEVCIGTEKPYSSFINQNKNLRSFKPILIGLEAEREVIYERINQRVDTMMKEGLLEEAKNTYPQRDLNALQTVGYKELFSYLNNEITLDFAIEEIKKNTRRFAKRQMTWFKRSPDTKWFDFDVNKNDIVEHINNQL